MLPEYAPRAERSPGIYLEEQGLNLVIPAAAAGTDGSVKTWPWT